MRVIFCSILLTALLGCSNQLPLPFVPPLVTAKVTPDATQILWLETKDSNYQNVQQIMLLADGGHFNAEYRWRQGEVREIERKGAVRVNGDMKQLDLLLRYDTHGNAVYQLYRINGDIYPLKNAELKRYHQEATTALDTAKSLNKKNIQFFQGYWVNNKFRECLTNKVKRLDVVDPESAILPLTGPPKFIAAIGMVGNRRNVIDSIVKMSSGDTPCFIRPFFNMKNEAF